MRAIYHSNECLYILYKIFHYQWICKNGLTYSSCNLQQRYLRTYREGEREVLVTTGWIDGEKTNRFIVLKIVLKSQWLSTHPKTYPTYKEIYHTSSCKHMINLQPCLELFIKKKTTTNSDSSVHIKSLLNFYWMQKCYEMIF